MSRARVELPEGMEMVMPGDNVQMTIELITPIAMEEAAPVRYPRRWPDGWCRRGDKDPEIGNGNRNRNRKRSCLPIPDPASRVSKCLATKSFSACNDCKNRNYFTTKNKRLASRARRVEEVLPALQHSTSLHKETK